MELAGSLRADPAVLAALVEAARSYKMSAGERFEQRVSFVYGQLGGGESGLTKDQVREKLREFG